MTSGPYAQATAILDAAAAGGMRPGDEEIGRLLVDLGRTSPVPAGSAIGSAAVAAATAATGPGVTGLVVGLIKPIVVVLSMVAVAGVVVVTTLLPRGSSPTSVPEADRVLEGVERVVGDSTGLSGAVGAAGGAQTGETLPADTSDGTATVGSEVSPEVLVSPGPGTVAVPNTTIPLESPITTVVVPSTTAMAPPTTNPPSPTTSAVGSDDDPPPETDGNGNGAENANENGAGNAIGNPGRSGERGGGNGNGNRP
jgi:hypothetical protein